MNVCSIGVLTVLLLAGTCQPSPLSFLSAFWNKLDIVGKAQRKFFTPSSRSKRVLNFISVPVSRECLAGDGRRSGICLNPYECKIQEGVSDGKCALGFGVCCVFSETCGSKAFNNITYFVNPHFPGLSPQARSCHFTIKKIAPQISQIRLDFVHFNLAQPNRKTGICETDIMVINSQSTPEFRLCGLNNGQHIYYDVEEVKGDIEITMNLTKEDVGRLWEIKAGDVFRLPALERFGEGSLLTRGKIVYIQVTQIEFRNKAPTGCMQYFREPSGTIQTMNFADNGRHLADQDYTICVRQESGMCSIVYEPCDENSFKIGPPTSYMNLSDEGSGAGDDTPEARDDECSDRVVMPCDSEEFIMPKESLPGVCDLLHCGSSFCTMGENPCRIESSTIPFNIRVQFGPALREESPDDNLGMCLKFEQQPCS